MAENSASGLSELLGLPYLGKSSSAMPLPQPYGLETIYPVDENPEFTQMLGRLTARWAAVEDEMATSLGHLLNGQRNAAITILYTIGSFKARSDIVRSMVLNHMPNGPEKKEILNIMEKLSDLSKHRNKLIHGQYVGVKSGLVRITIAPGTKTPTERTTISTTIVADHIKRVEWWTHQLKLMNATNTRAHHPPPWQDKH